jgi:hypothetical protein
MSSNELCKACALLEGLEKGIAGMGVVRPTHLLALFDIDPLLTF